MGYVQFPIKNINKPSGLRMTGTIYPADLNLIGNTVTGDWGTHSGQVSYSHSGQATVNTSIQIDGVGYKMYQRNVSTPTTVNTRIDLSELKLGAMANSYNVTCLSGNGVQYLADEFININITSVKAEKPTNIRIVGDKVIQLPIKVDFDMASKNTCTFELIKDTVVFYSANIGTARTHTIPANTIKETSGVSIRIRSNCTIGGISNTSDWTTLSLSVSDLQPVISSLSPNIGEISGNANTRVSWSATNQDTYKLECIQDNKVRATLTGTTDKECYILPRVLIGDKEVTLKLTVTNSKTGLTAIKSVTVYNKYTAEKPSNLRIIGEKNINKPIRLAWDITDTTGTRKLELQKDEITFFTVNLVANTKEYYIPANTIKELEGIRVRVKNIEVIGQSIESEWTILQLSGLTQIELSVTNIALSGTNRDYDINVSWESVNQHYFKLKVNNRVVATGSDAKIALVPCGTFNYGDNTLVVEIEHRDGNESLYTSVEKVVNITHDIPLIYSLEPSNLSINTDRSNNISFSTNAFCDRWELMLNGTSVWSGTDNRIITVPPNTFNKGNNTLILRTYYSPVWNSGEVRTAIREASFTGYDKPRVVTLDGVGTYNTAQPTITWQTGSGDNDKQVAYEIEIIKGDKVVESKVEISSATSYTVKTALENNTTYTVKVSIKNKFEIWSDFSAKVFNTLFNDLPIPTITLTNNEYNVTVSVSSNQVSSFKEIKIYRKSESLDWVEIANNCNTSDTIVDNTIQCNVLTYYKARYYDTTGGYSESQTVSTILKLVNYTLVDVQRLSDNIQLDYVEASFNKVTHKVYKTFSGSHKPSVYGNNLGYSVGSLKCTLEIEVCNKLEQQIEQGEIFCYRDWRGRKLYCFIEIADIKYMKHTALNEATLKLTEIKFDETGLFSGEGFRRIIYLDGTYKLEDSIKLDGYESKQQRSVLFNVQ